MREVAPLHWALLTLLLPQYAIPALPLAIIAGAIGYMFSV